VKSLGLTRGGRTQNSRLVVGRRLELLAAVTLALGVACGDSGSTSTSTSTSSGATSSSSGTGGCMPSAGCDPGKGIAEGNVEVLCDEGDAKSATDANGVCDPLTPNAFFDFHESCCTPKASPSFFCPAGDLCAMRESPMPGQATFCCSSQHVCRPNGAACGARDGSDVVGPNTAEEIQGYSYDCCSGVCGGDGYCGAVACKGPGAPCTSETECCPSHAPDGSTSPAVCDTTCRVSDGCVTNGDCLGGDYCDHGHCLAPCIATGDEADPHAPFKCCSGEEMAGVCT
jgi:hypothetical protein